MSQETVHLPVRLLHPDAKLPEYATEGSAGMDVFAYLEDAEPVVLKPMQTKLIKTGLQVEVPVGYELQVRSKSGLAAKNAVFVTNSPGTVDSDYRGEVCVILTNAGFENLPIKHGMKIAQILVMPHPKVVITVSQEDFEATQRGAGGFGSTGA